MAKTERNQSLSLKRKIYTVISREWALPSKFNTFRSILNKMHVFMFMCLLFISFLCTVATYCNWKHTSRKYAL